MSKHNRNNYNKMYEQKNDVEKTVDAAEEYNAEVEETEEDVEVPEVSLEDSVEDEEDIEFDEPKQIIGTVVNCNKLAVRKSPKPAAEMIVALDAYAKVMVDIENSTINYYKVCTEAGVEGYCVKDYIAVV